MSLMATFLLVLTTLGTRDEATLTPQNKAEIEARTWRVGQELRVVLPVQTGTAFLWDLDEARCEGNGDHDAPAVQSLTAFDDPKLREMTPEERRLYNSGDGPLGGHDRMQMIRVRLERAGTVSLVFRKYRSFDRKPSEAQRDRFAVRLRVVPAPE